jgi:hypothetical protein
MTAAGAAAVPVRAASVLWRFSRPHTIVGTVVSVAGLFTIVAAATPGLDAAHAAFHLFWTLVAAASVNVFIVGVNQISDVEIDRVNKPFLPIAAGELTPAAAWWIVAASGALPLVLALTQGVLETAAVSAALAVGALYSLPPARDPHLHRPPRRRGRDAHRCGRPHGRLPRHGGARPAAGRRRPARGAGGHPSRRARAAPPRRPRH